MYAAKSATTRRPPPALSINPAVAMAICRLRWRSGAAGEERLMHKHTASESVETAAVTTAADVQFHTHTYRTCPSCLSAIHSNTYSIQYLQYRTCTDAHSSTSIQQNNSTLIHEDFCSYGVLGSFSLKYELLRCFSCCWFLSTLMSH